MNTLAYGLLSLLSREPRSGYDLMLAIQPFWEAKHSQIYPLLAKLEEAGHVTHTLVQQANKPDKKVYTITASGITELEDWLRQPTSDPVLRDEMLMKVYSSWLGDHETAKKLFEDRIAAQRKRLHRMESLIEKFLANPQELNEAPDVLSPAFGRYILIQRNIDVIKSEIDWCHFAIALVEKSADKKKK